MCDVLVSGIEAYTPRCSYASGLMLFSIVCIFRKSRWPLLPLDSGMPNRRLASSAVHCQGRVGDRSFAAVTAEKAGGRNVW